MCNLAQQELATLLILSKATITNIEAGKESVANDILLIICKFLGFTKVALENEGFTIEDRYRERLAKKHGKRYNILHEQPELKFAIRHYCGDSDEPSVTETWSLLSLYLVLVIGSHIISLVIKV